MKRNLCMIVFFSVFFSLIFLQLLNLSVFAVTATPQQKSAASPVLTHAVNDTKAQKKNEIKKIMSVFMSWKGNVLITRDGEYKLSKTTKLYDFADSKHQSAQVSGKATAELIFVDDKLNIVIIKPQEVKKP